MFARNTSSSNAERRVEKPRSLDQHLLWPNASVRAVVPKFDVRETFCMTRDLSLPES